MTSARGVPLYCLQDQASSPISIVLHCMDKVPVFWLLPCSPALLLSVLTYTASLNFNDLSECLLSPVLTFVASLLLLRVASGLLIV